MSTQNAIRRIKLTNLEHTAKRLRMEIENLCQTICINLDCSVNKPEDLHIDIVDYEIDELKTKWGTLIIAQNEIKRLEEELK